MANVLIASLGESPIVVTSMVKALQEGKGISLNKVIVLYPKEHPFIEEGAALVDIHCLCSDVEEVGLDFEDVNTWESCLVFLQTLYGYLEAFKSETVYLSLSGGRKSMSALMYLPAPFYENIKGVYHILDKYEGTDKSNFHSLEELLDEYELDDPELEEIMNPSLGSLNLIEIPFEHFADADELRKAMGQKKEQLEGEPLGIAEISLKKKNRMSSDAAEFWTSVFQKKAIPGRYEIRLSANAKRQFERPNINRLNFSRYFDKLKNSGWANKKAGKGEQGGKHTTFKGKDKTEFHVAKMITAQRVVWYLNQDEVVFAELGVEEGGQYHRVDGNVILNENYFKKKSAADYHPEYGVGDLMPSGEAILIAAVGESPMVVTQAYALLEHSDNMKITKVAVIFPKQNGVIETGIQILENVFETRDVKVVRYGIDRKDVDSKDACEIFLRRMIQGVNELKGEYPESDIRMLLSGGRKGMTALSFLAAQRSHITRIYHTLITDPELEKMIKNECSIEALNQLNSVRKRAEKMFLESYPKESFELVNIPVIPLQMKAEAKTMRKEGKI